MSALSVRSRIEPWQRFTRSHPCPICQGYDADRRGRGERCYGFLSADETAAFCTREERAGDLPLIPASQTYAHQLDGPCGCGMTHGVALAPVRHRRDEPERDPDPQTGPLPAEVKGKRFVAEWAYRRADGSVAYRVARYDDPLKPGESKPDKTFRQFRQLDEASWAWGLGDTERLLYRLPEILAGPASRPVFVVEGEKAADALAALGLVVTTCSEGARKWDQAPGRHEALRDRHVVVLPDKDEKGLAHALQVAEDLRGCTASVCIVELPGLPEKGDAVEWIAAGGDALQLMELAVGTLGRIAGTAQSQNPCPVNQDDSPESGPRQWERLRWTRQIRSNASLSASAKWAAMVARDKLDTWADDAWVPIDLTAFGGEYGVSAQTASSNLRQLQDAGGVEYRVEKTTQEDAEGVPRTFSRAYIKRAPLLMAPLEIQSEPRNWGGKRPGAGRRCKSCGSENLVIRRQLVCRSCGEKQEDLPDIEVNPRPEEETGEESLAQESCPTNHLDLPGEGDERDMEDDPEVKMTSLPQSMYVSQDDSPGNAGSVSLQELRERIGEWAQAREWAALIVPPAHRYGGSREMWERLLRGASVEDLRRVYMALGAAGATSGAMPGATALGESEFV